MSDADDVYSRQAIVVLLDELADLRKDLAITNRLWREAETRADTLEADIARMEAVAEQAYRLGWALIDTASGKLLAGAFRTEAEAKRAQWRLGMGRIELVTYYLCRDHALLSCVTRSLPT